MERSGGEAGRPFRHYTIEQLEAEVRKVRQLNDVKALRAELGHRKSKRAAELDDLLARLNREWSGSFNPNADAPSKRKPEGQADLACFYAKAGLDGKFGRTSNGRGEKQ
jgi:hypothetical protein